MRILYVTNANPWNPTYGATIRSYGILRGLDRRHELHVALASAYQAEIDYFEQEPHASLGVRHVLRPSSGMNGTGKASSLKSGFRPSFLDLLDRVNPDVVWYFTKYVIRQVGFPGRVPCVLDLDDLPWRKLFLQGQHQQGKEKIITFSKVLPSFIEDLWVSRRADAVVISNHRELRRIRFGKAVVPLLNGFDFPEEVRVAPREGKRLLFFGSLFYDPNLDGVSWFCSEVWPRIRAAEPDAQLDLVGFYESGLEEAQHMPGVNFHGFIEDLDECIRKSAFLIVPLRIGSGTRIKILEAWSKGLPVVTTKLGAEGLGVKDGETALVGDTPEEFAAACILLLQSPELGSYLAANGYKYGKERFSWPSIYPTLDKIIDTAMNSS